jgi:hypothetical protein
VQLTLVGENGTVAASTNDPGGVDGDAYTVGTDHVYFIDGTTVKAMGRDGTITDAGQVPQVSTTATATDESSNIAFAISPDESTLVFGIPRAVAGDNGATIDDSQLWTEAVGDTAASATMVYDNSQLDKVLLPFAWSNTSLWVGCVCRSRQDRPRPGRRPASVGDWSQPPLADRTGGAVGVAAGSRWTMTFSTSRETTMAGRVASMRRKRRGCWAASCS